MLKRNKHNPAHLHLDNTLYFISGKIFQKRPLLNAPSIKDHLLETMKHQFTKYLWQMHHWVILDNHYHVLCKSRKGKDMALIFRAIHGSSGQLIRKKTRCKKPVWWNYWDYCPRDEKEYITR